MKLKKQDAQVYKALEGESKRQEKEGMEMIASENYVSGAVLEALGSVFTNKYSRVIREDVIMAGKLTRMLWKLWRSNGQKNYLEPSMLMCSRIRALLQI